MNSEQIEKMLIDAQMTELSILKDVDSFCKENNLKYSLGYGTLLGAVRHKGFIPWDDDIDIWMPREDYDKMLSIWGKSHPKGYVLMNIDTNNDFDQSFSKIRKDNTTFLQEGDIGKSYHKGIFVDIFPFEHLANNSVGCKKQKIYSIFLLLFTRKFSPKNEGGIKGFVSKLILKAVPKSKYEKYRKICESKILKLAGKDTQYFCPVTFGDISRIYPKDMFENIEQMLFENSKFSVTSKWDECLKIRYGDYMQLPPEEEREWKHHPILIDLNKNYD